MEPGSILTADMKRLISEQRLGHVATVCPDGTPNLSPKGTIAVWDDRTLVFAEIRSPNTVKNLRLNPNIELNVIDPIGRKGYRFKGTAAVVTEGPRFEQGLAFFEPRVERARDRVQSIVFIAVSRARPLTSPAYDLGHTESDVKAQWWAHYSKLHAGTTQTGEVPDPSPCLPQQSEGPQRGGVTL